MQSNQKDLSLAILYFLMSIILTTAFIGDKYALYENVSQMILSISIAGAKWGIQLIAAFAFMGRKKFGFIRAIGWVCLIGSLILLSVFLMPDYLIPARYQFTVALFISVSTMLILYYNQVKQAGVGIKWFFGWVACLIIAILLQLTIVFHIL